MRLYSISQTVLGERTCKVCGGLDGKRFKLSEKQEGVNFPPVHPNCRCTTIGYDPDDDIAELENKQEQLSYEEWYQQYVEGREQKRIESNDTVAVELPSGSPRPIVSGGNAANVPINSLTQERNGGIIYTDKQFGKKAGEHCEDWRLDKTSSEGRTQLKAIINDIFYNHNEIRIGAYSGQPTDVLFYIKGENVVVTKQNNEFITVLKGGITSDRVKNARKY